MRPQTVSRTRAAAAVERDEPDTSPSDPTMPPIAARDIGAWLRRYWVLIALGILAMVIAVTARHLIFPAYSWNRDEPVFLWQADGLRAGHFTMSDGGFPDLFHPWLSAAKDGKIFSQYTLGWPLVIVAGDTLFGTPDAAIALGALLTVLGTYALAREITRDHALALVAAAVMVASPILPIQGGVYLSYLFTLGLGLLFSSALLAGVRRAQPWRILVAGALLGWIFITRPYDAILWGVAIAAYLVYNHWREWGRLVRSAAWLALTSVPLIIATLAYNQHVTGFFGEFPITVADPLDRFGFGHRRIMPGFGKADYGIGKALRSTVKHGVFLPIFLAGSYLGVLAAAVGVWLRRRERSTLVLLALILVFPLGYFIFWGIYVSAATTALSGPIYYIPLYAPLAILIAATIVVAWRYRRVVGLVVVGVLLVATLPFAANRIGVNHNISEAQRPWEESTSSVDGRALVFVPGDYLMFLNPYSANKNLDGRVLFAVDKGARNLALMEARPDRTAYRQNVSLRSEDLLPTPNPRTPEVSITRLEVVRGEVVSVEASITNPTGAPAVVASIKVGDRIRSRTLSTSSTRDATYATSWDLGAAGTGSLEDRASVIPVTDKGPVTITVGYGSTAAAAQLPDVRQKLFYRVANAQVEMLMPSRPARIETVKLEGRTKLKRRWRPVDTLADLQVTVTPTG